MATATAPVPTAVAGGPVVLRDVSWDLYCQLRDAPRNDSVRMTYLDGDLTLMSPALRHDVPIELLSLLVRGVTAGMGLEIMGVRSTTLRREAGPGDQPGAGKEPDSAFYLGENERRMRRKAEINLDVDPPPDLAIEVESTHSSAASMAVYARLGVPEVWRFQVGERRISINRLAGASYREVGRSGALPKLTSALILKALDRIAVGDLGENAWLRWIEEWARALPEPTA